MGRTRVAGWDFGPRQNCCKVDQPDVYRDKCLRPYRIAQPAVQVVRHNSDDLQPGLTRIGNQVIGRRASLNDGEFDRPANGITVGKIKFGHGPVNDGNVGTVTVLSGVPYAPLRERYAQGGEELWTHQSDQRQLVFGRRLTGKLNRPFQTLSGGVALVEIADSPRQGSRLFWLEAAQIIRRVRPRKCRCCPKLEARPTLHCGDRSPKARAAF